MYIVWTQKTDEHFEFYAEYESLPEASEEAKKLTFAPGCVYSGIEIEESESCKIVAILI